MTRHNLTTRADILGATAHHPYAQFATGLARDIGGVAVDGATLWWGDGPLGRLGHALGDAETIDSLLPLLPAVDQLNLPRGSAQPAGYTHLEDWDFRWLTEPPPPQQGQALVGPVDDPVAIGALLDVAFPDSMLRPGHPMAIGWYGVWSDGALVACAADRSAALSAPTVGVLGAIAVHPDHRRSGWGAAVTAELTEVLLARHALVGLGVTTGNDEASRLYARLGFTGVHEIASIRPTPQ